MKTLEQIWAERNPQHELNADTEKDMFFDTAKLCVKEYIFQIMTIEEIEKAAKNYEMFTSIRNEAVSFSMGVKWCLEQLNNR